MAYQPVDFEATFTVSELVAHTHKSFLNAIGMQGALLGPLRNVGYRVIGLRDGKLVLNVTAEADLPSPDDMEEQVALAETIIAEILEEERK